MSFFFFFFCFIPYLISVASVLLVIPSPASQLHGFIEPPVVHGLGHILGLREEHSESHDYRAGLYAAGFLPHGETLPVSALTTGPCPPGTPPVLRSPNWHRKKSLCFSLIWGVMSSQRKELIQC